MRTALRTALSLALALVLLTGCSSVLQFAAPEPEQSVLEACAVFDSHKLRAAATELKKMEEGNPRAALKTMDSFATAFEASVEKVENPKVKVQAQLVAIAWRNFTAEIRDYQPTHAHEESTKADFVTLKKRLDKLGDLCGG